MLRIVAVVVCLLVGAAFARGADSSLLHARRAQAELGPAIWSEIIRIENDERASRYPHTLHAVVFELAGILWFYTDADGTQSLSLRRDRLAEEKANLSPLLRAIEPGFARWQVVSGGEVTPGRLPNGCFIASIAALRARLARGQTTERPRLLSYYVSTASGLQGHTVLAYAAGDAIEVIDHESPVEVRRFPSSLGDDDLALARAVREGDIARTRTLSLDEIALNYAWLARIVRAGNTESVALSSW